MVRLLATALALLALAPAAHAGGPSLALGAAEDVVRSADAATAKARMTELRLAGFRAVRVTTIWAPGRTAPTAQELTVLRNVTGAAALSGVRVFLSVYHAGSRTTPLEPADRAEFAAYAASLPRLLQGVRDLIVGNEPNLNRFWLPQFNPDGTGASAPAYLALLAEAFDAVKAAAPAVSVWGGALAPRGVDRPGTARDTISPTRFIRELGAAYRASGRTAPVMDGFAFHPYLENSSRPPDSAPFDRDHLGLVDYDRLLALLGEAFDGTAQPGSQLPILYDEFGVESAIPDAKLAAYTGTEPATTRPVDEATQARFYRRALELVFCQPSVVGLLLFHSHDETARAAWQSGVYYADGTPKTSLAPVRDALAATAGGSIARCGGLALKPKATLAAFPTRAPLVARLRCDLDCVWRARLVKLPAGSTTLAKSGRARGGVVTRVALPPRRLAPGRYQLVLALTHPVNPAPATLVRSNVLRLP